MPSDLVMPKFKSGMLHSGGPSGPRVKNRAQAIAIMMSEREKEKENGGQYPEHPLAKLKAKYKKPRSAPARQRRG